jgi:hypothetical protein
MAYIRLGTICALHVECGRELGARPLFASFRHGGERVFDMPYCRAIFTPGRRLAGEMKAAGCERNDSEHKGIYRRPARTAEDRP